MFRASLPLVLFAIFFPIEAQPNPDALLERAIARIRQTLDRLPDYVCRQTVDRSQTGLGSAITDKNLAREYGCVWGVPPQQSQPTTIARLRPHTVIGRLIADVASTSEGERYSWPGASRFENQEMLGLAPLRENSSGAFSGFLRSIFAADTTSFVYRGEAMTRLASVCVSCPAGEK